MRQFKLRPLDKSGFKFGLYLLVFIGLPCFGFDDGRGKPLWQLGVGAGTAQFANYLGAEGSEQRYFPVLLPIYRGRFIQSDEEGVRGELYEDQRFRFNIGGDFSFGGGTDAVSARADMPKLPSVLQLGPSLQWSISEMRTSELWLDVSLRAAVSQTDARLDYHGAVLNPRIVYRHKFSYLAHPLKAAVSVGPLWATDSFNQLYYEVAPQFARLDRPQYDAVSGYNGTRFQLTLSSFSERYFAIGVLRYDNTRGAANADSPLLERQHGFGFALMMGYFMSSSERVAR